MDNLKTKVLKRIQSLDLSLLYNTIDELEDYNVLFYDKDGIFNFTKFRNDCIRQCDILSKNDVPNSVTGIRYKLADFMSNVQIIIGIRNMAEFMSK
jgi:hypothetical protein